MQVTPILISLALISIVQAALVTRIPKPKLNLMHSQNLQSTEILKHKSPEERRKLSLFPKSYMKYVISSEPIYKIATHKPMVHGTKRPLMKKLNPHHKNKKNIETERLIKSTELTNKEEESSVTPKVETVLISEEISIEVVEDKSEESNENENNNKSQEEDKLQNDSNEVKTTSVDIENEESLNIKDLLYLPIAKPIEASPENKKIEAFSDVSNRNKESEEIETPDWTEFIFIDPAHTRSDKMSSEDPEEYVTTEFYEEPEIVRQKRGSNVIEEENRASTVAGYKYTWKDTRLNNDVAFKNIHS